MRPANRSLFRVYCLRSKNKVLHVFLQAINFNMLAKINGGVKGLLLSVSFLSLSVLPQYLAADFVDEELSILL